jgi:shikimate dehydrogenase
MSENGVKFSIRSNSEFILSTSGRLNSLKRYKALLQDILELDIVYIPFHSGKENGQIDPLRFTNSLRGLPCIGGAISKDIKHSIIPYLDSLDESASTVNSVNTVIVGPKLVLTGYNTDVLGFRYAIIEGIKRSGKTISTAVCYGYGGVAFVVVNVLQALGIKCVIAGRSLEKAKERAAELSVEVWQEGLDCQLFVNATPATEHPLEEAPNLLSTLQGATIIFDHEMPGEYLRQYCAARESEITYIAGTDMYYPQMAAQWRLFLQNYLAEDQLENLQILLQQAENYQS